MDEMIKRLDEILKKFNIPYVFIGGVAASVLGKPRMTTDADVVVIITKRRLSTLLATLKLHGFKISRDREIKILEKLKNLLPVKISYKEGFSVDIRVASYSLDKNAIKRALKIELFGKMLSISTPEDLVLYKSVRFNELDRADIKAVISRFKGKLDIPYLEEAIQTLIQETGNEKIKKNLLSIFPWRDKNWR